MSRKVEILREGKRRSGGGHDLNLVLGYAFVHRFEETGDTAFLHEARDLFEKQVEERPSSPRPYLGLAFAALSEGKDGEAITYVKDARRRISLTEDDADGYDSFWVAVRLLLSCDEEGKATAVNWLSQESENGGLGMEPDLVLGALFEDEDPARAAHHLDQARARWEGSAKDLNGYLQERRDWVKGITSGGD